MNYSYDYATRYPFFGMSESMHIYHRATSYEHLALNQHFSVHYDQFRHERVYTCQRNAIWYFLHAALKGYSNAQYKLGMIYLQGQLGLLADQGKARKWLSLAAHQGHVEAQNQLHQIYLQ
ncbi:sel1 repeat family protein [Acinetobacter sp.]|jgi:TPR repeat protein|uniref:tetratricopeptide repeat protein n=1 Tax=Acinetobacter sp. TaxID=472 RepID=UPI00282CA288|nr:sel1 repeat family protein [Acinetobacter sp.]MDR0236491.1 sel1 repeat family protein [Acinetobacter sp.]